MITLYRKDATNFENNGLGSIDQNIINPEISWIDNGAFTLEFKYPLFAKHGKEIENSSIIKCNDADGSNLFFVYKVTPSMGYLTVLCYQISYKLAFNSINDTNIVEKNGQMALNQLSNATQYPHQFKFFSDIQTTASSRVVRKNPIEFLLDTSLDNCFLNRWGGHIVRQNFNISMNNSYGSNKGYVIRHKKDLKGYEAQFDESTVITRIRPIGYDGLLFPELYVDSNLISSYPEPRISQFEYSNVKVAEKAGDEGFATKELAYAELRRLAKLEFSKNKVDIPDFSAKVEFVNLKQTDEYKDLQSLKDIKTGDTVKVIHAQDNFEISAQMVEYKFNPLNNSYISITLGNYSKSFTSTVSKISQSNERIDDAIRQAQNAYFSASGKNTVYNSATMPIINKNNNDGDLLYLKNGDKIELWILEKVNEKLQWVLQVSDSTQEELKSQMNQAQLDIADAVDSANDAVDKANHNIRAIGELDVKLIDTKALTDKALADVNKITAENKVLTDKALADVNKITAENKVLTDKAQVDATKAIADVKIAYDKTVENSGKIVTANQEIDKIKGEITQKVSQTDFDKSLGRITKNESSITQNANAITQKVSSTDVENILTGKAYATKSELTQTSNSLTSTISGVRTDLDAISIGGQNLATQTITPLSVTGNNTSNQAVNVYPLVDKLANLVSVNDFLTLSFNWSTTATKGKISVQADRDPYRFGDLVSATGTSNSVYIDISSNNQSGKAVIVFKVNNAVATSNIASGNFRFDFLESGKNLTISNYKLERGNKATDWSSADVDKANQTQVTQMVQDLNGFKTTVSNTYLTTSGANSTYPTKDSVAGTYLNKGDASNTYLNKNDASNIYPTKTTVSTQINQTATDITNSVQSWTNNKLTGYSTIQQTQDRITSAVSGKADKSQITQLSDQITSTVANISVGTNNIIQNGVALQGKEGWYQDFQGNGFMLASHDYYMNGRQQMFAINNTTASGDSVRSVAYRVKRNTEYSFSIGMFGGNVKRATIFILAKADDSSKNYDKVILAYQGAVSGAKVERKNLTFTNGDCDTLYIRVDHDGATNVGAGSMLYWTEVMMVEGNTLPASWVMSSAETASQSQISQMVQDLNGFKTTVSNTYLSSSSASSTYLNKTDASNTYPTKTTVSTQINQKATDITSSVQSWTNDKLTGYSTVQQTQDRITSAVSGKADKSQITQLSDQITSKVSVGDVTSQITQLKNDINLRIVEKGTVTSQINIESGKALISANQILLNADNVKFSGSAFIPSASIQNLSADKINTGTLNASNVNIVNLNANNITAGTLSGSNLKINLADGSITQDQYFTTTTFSNGYIKITDKYSNSVNNTATIAPYRKGIGGSSVIIGLEFTAGGNSVKLTDDFSVSTDVKFDKKLNVVGELVAASFKTQDRAFSVVGGNTIMNTPIIGGSRLQLSSYQDLSIVDTNDNYISVTAKEFYNQSLKSVKKNIKQVDFDALDEIAKTDITEFEYKNDNGYKTYGGIIGDGYSISEKILSSDKKAINLYSMNSLSWLAIQKLNKKIEQLEQKLKEK